MPSIEYFYSTHSAYAYIGARHFYDIAHKNGAEIIHKPIDLRPVVKATSGEPFGNRSDAHHAYFFEREVERWAEHRESPLIKYRPTWHDEPLALPNGLVIAAIEAGHNVDALSLAILKAHWLEDANFNDADVLSALARSVGIDAAPLLEKAMSDEIQAIHQANTKEAIDRNVFGSPTYFVNGDMFYGQDRLELVDRALTKPYADTWPRAKSFAHTWPKD